MQVRSLKRLFVVLATLVAAEVAAPELSAQQTQPPITKATRGVPNRPQVTPQAPQGNAVTYRTRRSRRSTMRYGGVPGGYLHYNNPYYSYPPMYYYYATPYGVTYYTPVYPVYPQWGTLQGPALPAGIVP